MGNPRVVYRITVRHTRPRWPDNITFLNIYFVESDEGTEELLRSSFTQAFTEEHPDWPIIKVDVEKE